MEDNRLFKVQILLQQGRYTEAETMLSDLLHEDATNVNYLSLLAEVNLQQHKPERAHTLIDNAIGLAPDIPHLYYIKSRICLQEDKLGEAEKYISRAIALDPYDADYLAFLGQIKLALKKYEEALQMADRALEVDAENLLALNTRSTALVKLNRSEESFATIQGALREDPFNAYTHANYGWGLLEKGDHKKAMEHFKEALSSDPNMKYAQAGMLEALKARNPVYRLFLRYSFWIGNLTARYQWGFIIAFYLGFRGLKVLARSSEQLRPYLMPLVVALAIVAFSTWIITPIGNLFLRFNKYGQLLLDKKQRMSSNFVAISLCIFLTGVILYFATAEERMLAIAVFGFAMMLPLGTMFSPSRNKYALLIYTIVLGAVGIAAVAMAMLTGEVGNLFSAIFALGFMGFQWVANYMLIRENNPR